MNTTTVRHVEHIGQFGPTIATGTIDRYEYIARIWDDTRYIDLFNRDGRTVEGMSSDTRCDLFNRICRAVNIA